LPRHVVLLLSVLASAALHASPLDIGAQQRGRSDAGGDGAQAGAAQEMFKALEQ
jgi:hypothetical protein